MTIYDIEWSFTEGDYRFQVWFDSGNLCAFHQRDVYVSQLLPSEQIALGAFSGPELLAAYQGADRTAREETFAAEVARVHAQNVAESGASRSAAAQKRRKRQQRQDLDRLERNLSTELRALPREAFNLAQLHKASRQWDDGRFLRSFYYDEVNDRHIRNFGRKYATDADYRAQVYAGTTAWAGRNALFERNLIGLLGGALPFPNARAAMKSPPSPQTPPQQHHVPLLGNVDAARDVAAERLWRWCAQHAAAVLQMPEYEALHELDMRVAPSPTEIDREIAPAVEVWKRVPGVRTRFSCQGVSGAIHYGDRRLLVPSYHEALAYIAFAEMDPTVAASIEQLSSACASMRIISHRRAAGTSTRLARPEMGTAPKPPTESVYGLVSVDPDQNIAFRQEARTLAERVLTRLTGA